jgi:ATP/ADP translocase
MIECRPEEWRTAGTSFVCHFLILSSYYIIRPIRDEIGVSGGVGNLPWLFTAALAAMLVANALFSALVGLFLSAALLEVATWCVRHFPARAVDGAGTMLKTSEQDRRFTMVGNLA